MPTYIHPCELAIYLPSEVFWLHPSQVALIPGNDQPVHGVLEVDIQNKRAIEGIEITLRGQQHVGVPHGPLQHSSKPPLLNWSDKVVFERKLWLTRDGSLARNGHSEEGVLLQRGTQDFEFLFILPAWAAPYERCKYGNTRYVITATVHGAGRIGGAVSTSRDIFPIQQLTEDGGPTPFEVAFRGTHESLGNISLELSTVSLTVGGIMHLNIVHPHPLPQLTVYMVDVFIEQQFTLYDLFHKRWTKAPLERLRIWSAGSVSRNSASPLYEGGGKRMGGGVASHFPAMQPLDETLHPADRADLGWANGYSINALIRLPDDHTLRPTTARGSHTDICVSHEICIEIFFSRTDVVDERPSSETFGKPKVQVFSTRKHADLSSCVLTYDAVHLPPYSHASPDIYNPQSPATVGDIHLASPATNYAAERSHNKRHSALAIRSLPVSRAPSPIGHKRHSSTGRAVPQELPEGTPWVISNLRRRTGDTHHICVCGQTTDTLCAAEKRFTEGAPTAPGAWINTPKDDAPVSPWTPSSLPTSPTREWLSTLDSGASPVRMVTPAHKHQV